MKDTEDLLAWIRMKSAAQEPILFAGQRSIILTVTTDIRRDETMMLSIEVKPLKVS